MKSPAPKTLTRTDLQRPRAVLLDMDGTLTAPLLDYDAIRAEMGITGPILEAMRAMAPDRRRVADEVLSKHELHAARHSTLNDGCYELLDWLKQNSIRTGLITRNCAENVATVLNKHSMAFELQITREQEPTKPHPAPILFACQQLGVTPDQAWMVGDGCHDIEAGNAAKTKTVWISHNEHRPFQAEPWRTVISLPELLDLLQSTT